MISFTFHKQLFATKYYFRSPIKRLWNLLQFYC